MLIAYPKLDDGKEYRRKPVWFLFFAGHDEASERTKVELVLWWRPDLMHPMFDRGASIPAALAFQWSWISKVIRDLGGMSFDFKFRSRNDSARIAWLLAGRRDE